jgi:hypothetical protein
MEIHRLSIILIGILIQVELMVLLDTLAMMEMLIYTAAEMEPMDNLNLLLNMRQDQ